MSEWGKRIYGDPCDGCGYDWSIPSTEALALVEAIQRRFIELLRSEEHV